jgi:hypothetical protein
MYITCKIHYGLKSSLPVTCWKTENKRYILGYVTGGLQKIDVTRDASLVRV